MNVIDYPQGSAEWLASRAGKVTASRISDVLAKIKSGEAASRADYRAQIVAEILTGAPQEAGYVSPEMQWGTATEPFARAAYELRTDRMVDTCGLVIHPTIERAGASPDGLVAPDGLLEVKCPKTATHLQYLIAKEVPAKYRPQMLWQMACTGRAWCDFVSFDPRLPERHQLLIARLERDDKAIKNMETEVLAFLAEVDAIIKNLEG